MDDILAVLNHILKHDETVEQGPGVSLDEATPVPFEQMTPQTVQVAPYQATTCRKRRQSA
jgi:hypothetical protein